VIGTLDQLAQRGNRIVIFEGGEPMLWRDHSYTIQDVIQEAKKRFDRVGMTTNGTIALNVNPDILWVSIDGLAETHNSLRRGRIFERVMENIQNSSHPKILAHITINNRNYSEISDLILFLAKKVQGITIQLYYPYHRDDRLFLDFDLRKKCLDEIISLKKAGYPILNSSASLKALQLNNWHCFDLLMDNAHPDGSITQGCYLRGRGDIDCKLCGFSPHTEISLAFQGNPQAILAGKRIFFSAGCNSG
jgi:Fe-coproporphyrin III synthase